MTDNTKTKDGLSTPPASPGAGAGADSAGRHHQRKASVGLSPFWVEQQPYPNEAVSSPKVAARGIIDVPMSEIAFFPLPADDCDSEERALPPEKRPSRRKSTSSSSAVKVPTRVVAVQVKDADAQSPQAADKKLVEIDIAGIETLRDFKSATSISSDSTVASSSDSIRSEFSENTAGSIWEDVPLAKPDAILGIAQAYQNCKDPRKVNVCVGAYRDENGKPWILPSVHQAERILWDDPKQTKEYLPIDGDRDFVQVAMRFAYGADIPMDHLAGVQTLSGTGACRVGGTFLSTFWPNHPIYCPNPTWGNHIAIFDECGLDVRRYRYYDRAANGLDLTGMLRDLQKAPRGSIILLHACAHNPTGCDPRIHEWKQIISMIGQRDHVAFFDCAYQGFASGDAEADASPFRYAVSQRVPIVLAQSFAKNFGLYGERCGTLSVVVGDRDQKERVLSELRLVIRPMYSSPPRHGSSIVKTILMDEDLKKQYYEECSSMARRIQTMRTKLVDTLINVVNSQHDWSHITRQIGMFAFTGLTPEMCHQLTDEYAIYLTTNGRISIAGLNDSNVEYVAKAIHSITDGKSMAQYS